MTRAPGSLARALAPETEPRRAAGRLAALLSLLAAATLAGTVALLPAGVDSRAVVVVAGLLALSAPVLRALPWERLPGWATPLPHVWWQALLGLGLGAWAGALTHYLPLYALVALHAGLTQPPAATRRLAPLPVAGALLALLGAEPAGHAVDLLAAALLSVVVTELLAASTRRAGTESAGTHALLRAVTALHGAGSEGSAADLVAELTASLLDPDGVVVLVASAPGSGRYVARGTRGVELDAPLVVDVAATPGVAVALQEGRALFVAQAVDAPLLAGSSIGALGFASVLLIPVPGEGGYLGCVVVGWSTARDGLDAYAQQVVALLTPQAGALLERLRSVGRLRQEASTDALTGLANRRVFLAALDRLRPGGAVVFLDLDHFKRLNDTQGHAAGDAVLAAFGRALRSSVRDGDCAARYGGEEFALVLPSAASVDMTAAAQVVVQRLLSRWDGAVTCSVGIATHLAGDAPSTTLARADAAVYEAKARGRDTVVVAAAPVPAQRSG